MKGKHILGKVDYNQNGNHECQFNWELTERENGPEFSMSADVWRPSKSDIVMGGQCCDEVASWFPNDKKAQRMVEVWRKYHLNYLNAGTPRQEAFVKDWEKENKYDYDKVCEAMKIAGIYEDKELGGLKSTGSFPVEVLEGKRGYRYGERWIYSEIPENVLNEIKSW